MLVAEALAERKRTAGPIPEKVHLEQEALLAINGTFCCDREFSYQEDNDSTFVCTQ